VDAAQQARSEATAAKEQLKGLTKELLLAAAADEEGRKKAAGLSFHVLTRETGGKEEDGEEENELFRSSLSSSSSSLPSVSSSWANEDRQEIVEGGERIDRRVSEQQGGGNGGGSIGVSSGCSIPWFGGNRDTGSSGEGTRMGRVGSSDGDDGVSGAHSLIELPGKRERRAGQHKKHQQRHRDVPKKPTERSI
jgi:hypothetical protein